MIRLSLFILLFSAFAAQAEEPVPDQDAPKSFPATFLRDRLDKEPFSTPVREVTFAMCGVEAHGKASDLDAGLIDFNVPDPARAAGGITDETKDLGRDARDYHSSVILGVTVGYRF
jgi:hypothetical protein